MFLAEIEDLLIPGDAVESAITLGQYAGLFGTELFGFRDIVANGGVVLGTDVGDGAEIIAFSIQRS